MPAVHNGLKPDIIRCMSQGRLIYSCCIELDKYNPSLPSISYLYPDLNAFFFWRTFRWQYKICICGGVSGWVQTHLVPLGWMYLSYLSDTTAGLLTGNAFIGQMRRSGALSKMTAAVMHRSFGAEVLGWSFPWRWKVLRREKSRSWCRTHSMI